MDAMDFPAISEHATIPSQLKTLADDKPDKPAFVFVDIDMNRTVLTRKDVWDLSRRYAGVLRRHGVKRGDVVCNCLVNSPEKLLSIYGTMIAGALPLQGQILLTDGKSFFDNLKTSACSTILVDPGEKQGACHLLNNIKYVEKNSGKTRYRNLPHLQKIIHVSVLENAADSDLTSVSENGTSQNGPIWLKGIPYEEDFYEDKDTNADDTAFLFITSGTTGYSKLVPQTHRSDLLCASKFVSTNGVIGEDSIYYNDRSLGWSSGQAYVYPCVGCTRVLTDHRRGEPEDVGRHMYRLLSKEQCDTAFMGPFQVSVLIDTIEASNNNDNDDDDDRSDKDNQCPFRFRQISCGGGPLSGRIMSKFGLIGDALSVAYGSTECLALCILHVKESDEYEPWCVGWPFPGVELKVVEGQGDALRDVGVDKAGEIIVRSPMVTQGYFNQPHHTQEVKLQDGWFRTGDVGYCNQQGKVFVFGRKDDVIMRGSFIQYPGWMEERLNKCPGVEKAMLVGVPDRTLHEEVCACVVSEPDNQPTEESLRSFCQEVFVSTTSKEVVPFPKYFLFFDKFPTNEHGVITRSQLKLEARQRLCIQEEV